jgi:hypothetical protein
MSSLQMVLKALVLSIQRKESVLRVDQASLEAELACLRSGRGKR